MVFQDSPIWKGMALMEYQTEKHKKEGFNYFVSWFQKVSVYLGCAGMAAGNTPVHAGRVSSIGFYIAADWEMEMAGGKWVSPSQVHSYWLSSTNQAPSATVCTVFRRASQAVDQAFKMWAREGAVWIPATLATDWMVAQDNLWMSRKFEVAFFGPMTKLGNKISDRKLWIQIEYSGWHWWYITVSEIYFSS